LLKILLRGEHTRRKTVGGGMARKSHKGVANGLLPGSRNCPGDPCRMAGAT
jgi:hypothetical protein